MNTTASNKLMMFWRVFRYVAIAFVIVLAGTLFYRGDYTRGIQCIVSFVVAFLAARGSMPIRSKDSWTRIVGVAVFIIAAAVFVSALVIAFIIK